MLNKRKTTCVRDDMDSYYANLRAEWKYMLLVEIFTIYNAMQCDAL